MGNIHECTIVLVSMMINVNGYSPNAVLKYEALSQNITKKLFRFENVYFNEYQKHKLFFGTIVPLLYFQISLSKNNPHLKSVCDYCIFQYFKQCCCTLKLNLALRFRLIHTQIYRKFVLIG